MTEKNTENTLPGAESMENGEVDSTEAAVNESVDTLSEEEEIPVEKSAIDYINEIEAAVEEAEADESEEVEPEAAEPEVIEPEVIEPEAVEPEAVEPEVVEPEVVEPEVVETVPANLDDLLVNWPVDPIIEDSMVEPEEIPSETETVGKLISSDDLLAGVFGEAQSEEIIEKELSEGEIEAIMSAAAGLEIPTGDEILQMETKVEDEPETASMEEFEVESETAPMAIFEDEPETAPMATFDDEPETVPTTELKSESEVAAPPMEKSADSTVVIGNRLAMLVNSITGALIGLFTKFGLIKVKPDGGEGQEGTSEKPAKEQKVKKVKLPKQPKQPKAVKAKPDKAPKGKKQKGENAPEEETEAAAIKAKAENSPIETTAEKEKEAKLPKKKFKVDKMHLIVGGLGIVALIVIVLAVSLFLKASALKEAEKNTVVVPEPTEEVKEGTEPKETEAPFGFDWVETAGFKFVKPINWTVDTEAAGNTQGGRIVTVLAGDPLDSRLNVYKFNHKMTRDERVADLKKVQINELCTPVGAATFKINEFKELKVGEYDALESFFYYATVENRYLAYQITVPGDYVDYVFTLSARNASNSMDMQLIIKMIVASLHINGTEH